MSLCLPIPSCHSPLGRRYSEQGHTLFSVLIAMAITASTALLGLTLYQHQWENTQLNFAEQQLSTLIAQGLSHARQLESTFVLCDAQRPEGFANWQYGITLRATSQSSPLLVRYWPKGITVTGPAHRFYLMPRAFDSETNGTFIFCTTSGRGRKLIINRIGQWRHEEVSEQDCQRRSPRQNRSSPR